MKQFLTFCAEEATMKVPVITFNKWLAGPLTVLAVTLLSNCGGSSPTNPPDPPPPPLQINLVNPNSGTYKVGQDTLICDLWPEMNPIRRDVVVRWWVSTPELGVERIHCGPKSGANPIPFLLNEFGDYLLPYLVPRGCGVCYITLVVYSPGPNSQEPGPELARDSVAITVEGP